MDVLGVITGAAIGMAATLAGVWLGVWLVRRLDAQATMPTIAPSPVFADLEPESPIRSPDLLAMWPQKDE